MYIDKYLYGIHVNVHYNLTRSSTTATLVLNIVRVDGWGIYRRIISYNGLPIIVPRCLSVSDLTLSLFVLYFSSFYCALHSSTRNGSIYKHY